MNASLPLSSPPKRIALLRLSAIGDCIHVLPVLHALSAHWPNTRITWVIGQTEHALFNELPNAIPNLDFIVYNKRGSKSDQATCIAQLKQQSFEVLLHMQTAFRASWLSRHIRAPIKLGFDAARSKDLQRCFTNHQISGNARVHFTDSFLQFLPALGVPLPSSLSWQLPVSADIHLLNLPTRYLLLAPCSSQARKDWAIEHYPAIIKHAWEQHQLTTVIVGAPTEREYAAGERLSQCAHTLNLVGKTNLKQLVLMTQNADCVLCPDSGPAHIATIADTPVVGLYATTNPKETGPYKSLAHCVNAYPEALSRFLHKTESQTHWGQRVKHNDAMHLITPEQVIARINNTLRRG